MKKISLVFASFVLLATTVLAGQQNPCNPYAKKAQNPCNPCAAKAKTVKGGTRTIVGFIGDSQCGLKHPMNMGDDKTCTLKCIEGGGKFILADRSHKVVYALDDAAQKKAREFAGQKVKVTGHVDAKAKSIHVTKIVAVK
ncbi:MAG TPA: hypothetical protein VNN73_08785 [Blastocatellia bacterium]|nr:hypothetical protein [Blastocatellia bacterium]